MARVATKTQSAQTFEAAEPIIPQTHVDALLSSTAATPVITLSSEQLAIASFVRDGRDNLLARARAGTGKTFVIRKCVPLMRGLIAIAAYNRKIAREIRAKLADDGMLVRTWKQIEAGRDGIDIETFHAYGWRVLRQSLKGVRREGNNSPKDAGFFKFDIIAERLKIAPAFQPLVKKAMERGQERLLEIKDGADAAIAAIQAAKDIAVAFLNGLVAFEKPQWREQAQSIANGYANYGYLTERQHVSVKMGARNAKQRIPAEVIVGRENAPVMPQKASVVDGLDPRWLDLASHYALELDLPADDHIEMQLALAAAPKGTSMDTVRQTVLHNCLVLAAKAIHESAKMAMETFRAIHKVKGRDVPGEEFTGVISFGEMLYLPIYFNLSIPQYDWVAVDEAQDSNLVRREFARRMLKEGGRFFWVGDDRQAIYGWAGADNDSLDQIIDQFSCRVFPMSTTFRCGKAIVALAQAIVPDYRAADTNPEGIVRTMSEADFHKVEMTATDAVICRNTAPLVKVAYKLIGRGVACHVEGRDIGKRLLPLLYRWPQIKNIAPYLDKLIEYRDAEIAKLSAQQQDAAVEELTDRVETIQAVIEFLPKGSKLADVQAHIESLFQDTPDGEAPTNVSLMTIHRSKGLEFPRVFGLGVNKYLPSPFAKQDWAIKQEANLEYVLKTRAINEYVDVTVV